MTTPDNSVPRRVNDLRDQLRILRAEVNSLLNRPSAFTFPVETRLAIVSAITEFGSPDATKGCNKYQIQFVDADFVTTVGQAAVAPQARGSFAIALDLFGGFIFPATIVIVARSPGLQLSGTGQWWIIRSCLGPYSFEVLDNSSALPRAPFRPQVGVGLCSLLYTLNDRLTAFDPPFVVNVWDPADFDTTTNPHSLRGQTCALPGERLQAIWKSDSPRFETIAPFGLRRKALVTAGAGIQPNQSGEVTFWAQGVTTPYIDDAHLNWMHGGEKVEYNTQAIVEFFRDEKKWVIVAAACEPEVAYGP